MLRVFSWLVAVSLLGGCYTQSKAVKQVNKALGSYPQIVARIALDSFPCDVIRIDTFISVRDTIIECIPVENFTTLSQIDTIYGTNLSQIDTIFTTKKVYVKLPYKTIYINKVVESTAKLVIINAQLDSVNNVIRELQKAKGELTGKVDRKNKVIWWLIGLLLLLSIPLVIRIFKMLSINI
jgi:hypothetical protein